MKVEFEGAKWEGEVWVPSEMSLNDDGANEVTMTIDGIDYIYFDEDMMDGLALMFARKDRKR